MAERTVWTNRLIDGAKLDALALNWDWKIDATSLADGSISDAELKALEWINSNVQAQIDAVSAWIPTDTPKEVQDIKVENTSPWTYDGVCVVITEWSIVKKYCPDGIFTYSNGVLVDKQTKTWTYDSETGKMVYTDGESVNLDWEYVVNDANIAYLNKNNRFKKNNVFDWVSMFLWATVSSLETIGWSGNARTFDWMEWNVQKLTLSEATTITFDNMLQGWFYTLFLVNPSNYTVNFAAKKYTGWVSTSLQTHSVGWVKPAVSATWTYILTVYVWETAAHFFVTKWTAQFTN